ncbi:MAG: hypothetical protein HY537_04780 [Deltaproteobacteria bacterium]|nr:hypothetical protein [Deltaproteobacteria bacterium]
MDIRKEMIVCLFILVGGIPAKGVGDEAWLPTERHFNASNKAAECTLYRSLLRKSLAVMNDSFERMETAKAALKNRRHDLEKCIRDQGLDLTEVGEEQAAELCPDAYWAWLRPTFSLHAAKEDRSEARLAHETTKNIIASACGDLPRVP